MLSRLVVNHVYCARLIIAFNRRESSIVISGPAVQLDARIAGVGRRLDFEVTLDVRALFGHTIDIGVKVPFKNVPGKLGQLVVVLPHPLNGLFARDTVQLFSPTQLLRKRTEEAVAITAHVHCLPTVGLESSEANMQVSVVNWITLGCCLLNHLTLLRHLIRQFTCRLGRHLGYVMVRLRCYIIVSISGWLGRGVHGRLRHHE